MIKKKIIDPHGHIICRKCSFTWPRTLDYFHKNVSDSYGMSRVCKKCDNTRRSIKEKVKAYHNYPRRCKACNAFFYTSRAIINKANRRLKGYMNSGSYCSVKCVINPPNGISNWGMKGKSWGGKRRGSLNPRAILNEDKVKKIKIALLEGYSNATLAHMYGVDDSSISSIKNHRSWKHVSIDDSNI